jgi:hypothetical protein
MLSYRAEKYINGQILIFGSFALIGVVVFILGTFFNILADVKFGICIGFIPTGVLGVIAALGMKKDHKRAEKIITIKTEERLQYIRYKAGNLSFWITFICIAFLTVIARHISVPLKMFLSIFLITIAILHMITLVIYHKIS